jgi:hypothetical protein
VCHESSACQARHLACCGAWVNDSATLSERTITVGIRVCSDASAQTRQHECARVKALHDTESGVDREIAQGWLALLLSAESVGRSWEG